MVPLLVAVNPNAGRGDRLSGLEALIQQELRAKGFEPELLLVSHPGDTARAASLAKQRGDPFFVVAGGDGTTMEAANSLACSETRLGIIPTGTGNLLARELGIPLKPRLAVRLLSPEARCVPMDLGVVNGRYFSIMAGSGFGAAIMRRTDDSLKGRLGIAAYYWSGIRNLPGSRVESYHITAAGRTVEVAALTVLVANIGRLGPGRMRFGPGINPFDGLLDVCIVSVHDFAGGLRAIADELLFRPRRYREVTYLRVDEVTVESASPLAVQADGDLIGETPFRCRVAPGALRVISPLAH